MLGREGSAWVPAHGDEVCRGPATAPLRCTPASTATTAPSAPLRPVRPDARASPTPWTTITDSQAPPLRQHHSPLRSAPACSAGCSRPPPLRGRGEDRRSPPFFVSPPPRWGRRGRADARPQRGHSAAEGPRGSLRRLALGTAPPGWSNENRSQETPMRAVHRSPYRKLIVGAAMAVLAIPATGARRPTISPRSDSSPGRTRCRRFPTRGCVRRERRRHRTDESHRRLRRRIPVGLVSGRITCSRSSPTTMASRSSMSVTSMQAHHVSRRIGA